MQATNAKAHNFLEQNRTELMEAMKQQGINLRHVEVQLRLDLGDKQQPGHQQGSYSEQGLAQNPGSYNQSQGDGWGQGGSKPGQEQNQLYGPDSDSGENLTAATVGAGRSDWQQLTFQRLDVKG
jgi:hypothetical protein